MEQMCIEKQLRFRGHRFEAHIWLRFDDLCQGWINFGSLDVEDELREIMKDLWVEYL